MAGASRREVLIGAAALAATPALAVTPASFSLRNARVVVGDGTVVDGGVRVEGGKIVEVGPGVRDGTDLAGATLFPGFYDGGSALGLYEIDLEPATHDAAETSDAIVPQARAVDGWNPRSALLPVARISGVLGALVIPGGGLVSGQAAWMRVAGDTVAEATLKAPAAVCVHLGHPGGDAPNAPKTRMGVAMKLRDLLDKNEPAEPTTKGMLWWRREVPPDEKELSRGEKTLRALRRRETKALFVADRADDLLLALDLAREYALDAVLLGCTEGHLVARQLADAEVPVLLGPVTVQPASFETLHARYDNAAKLHAAGVRFGLRQGNPHQLRDLPTEAAVAVAHGLPWEAAIAAACGNGPGFWGLDVGLIKVGHEATFAQATGDPLQPRTAIRGVWIRGEATPMTSRQTELYERYRTLR